MNQISRTITTLPPSDLAPGARPAEKASVTTSVEVKIPRSRQKKIWIDLDNSPHVPFFLPIIEELQKLGHEVLLTARNSYQVCELLELNHLSCEVVGTHWGKNRLLKVAGTCVRAGQLI